MKQLTINKPVNLELLTEQLFAAFPGWKHPDPMGRGWDVTDVIVTAESITYPNETEESAVQAVIDLHNPDVDSINQKQRKDTILARAEMGNIPAWLKTLDFQSVETYIQNNTVGGVTKQQALTAVSNAANLNDIKNILTNVVNAVYGLVEVNKRIARVVLMVVFYLEKKL